MAFDNVSHYRNILSANLIVLQLRLGGDVSNRCTKEARIRWR